LARMDLGTALHQSESSESGHIGRQNPGYNMLPKSPEKRAVNSEQLLTIS
jgi:hypothetical protein